MNVLFIIFIIFAYLFGSINFAIIVAYLKRGVDIRDIGSHNAGADNVGRNIDWRLGLLVGILDGLKGFLPLIFAKWLGAPNTVLLIISAAAILGHDYPIYYHFKGGTGVATTIGCALFFAPKETILIYLFIIPIGFFTQHAKKKNINLPGPPVVASFILYMYFIFLIFMPGISNVVKMFSLLTVSIVVLKKSDIALRFVKKFFVKLYVGIKG